MKLLKQLYKIYSPSKGEKPLKRFIRQHITDTKLTYDSFGNMYLTKGIAKDYPCIVAHLDQVQTLHSTDFTAIETNDIIFGYSPSNRRQEGLGADDKNGVWIALKCLEKYDTIKVAFFVQEEIGCIGSRNADMSFFDDCRFVVQPDRIGYHDLITSIGWDELCSKEFIKATNHELYGYEETDGMFTDVAKLKDIGLPISCINVSCGYYEPHSDKEFTVKKDLLNCLTFVENIIENCQEIYPHEIENRNTVYYDEILDLIQDQIYENPQITAQEIKDYYGCYYPELEIQDFQTILDLCNMQNYNF